MQLTVSRPRFYYLLVAVCVCHRRLAAAAAARRERERDALPHAQTHMRVLWAHAGAAGPSRTLLPMSLWTPCAPCSPKRCATSTARCAGLPAAWPSRAKLPAGRRAQLAAAIAVDLLTFQDQRAVCRVESRSAMCSGPAAFAATPFAPSSSSSRSCVRVCACVCVCVFVCVPVAWQWLRQAALCSHLHDRVSRSQV
jgi:hypothetical protein